MELKFKKLSDKAVAPVRAHKTDAGLDLTTIGFTTTVNEAKELMLVYHTDIAVEIPEGYVGLLFPRSSIYKKSLMQTNCVGVIDSGYRGEIMVVYKTTTNSVPEIYKAGERFCQLVIVPVPQFDPIEVEELSESDRGEGGFGSTGNEENVERSEESVDVPTNNVERENTDDDSTNEGLDSDGESITVK